MYGGSDDGKYLNPASLMGILWSLDVIFCSLTTTPTLSYEIVIKIRHWNCFAECGKDSDDNNSQAVQLSRASPVAGKNMQIVPAAPC